METEHVSTPEPGHSDESHSDEAQTEEPPADEPRTHAPEVAPPWPTSVQPLREQDLTGNPRTSRVNQPWRAAVACAEALVAVLMIAASVWAWHRGSITIEVVQGEEVTHLFGSWLTLSVLFVTVAGLALLDAGRQLLLALGTARRRGGGNVTRTVHAETG